MIRHSCVFLPVASVVVICLAAANIHAAPPAGPSIEFPPGKDTVTIPLRRAGAYLCVPVSVNGQEAGYYLIDTGSAYSALDPAFATKLNLPSLGKSISGSPTGPVALGVHEAQKLVFGGVSVANPPLLEVDLGATLHANKLDVQGVLGYDILGRIPFTLDFRTADLTLYRPGTFVPVPGQAAYAIRTVQMCPSVRVEVNREVDGWFMLDSGGQNASLTRLGKMLLPDLRNHRGRLGMMGAIGGGMYTFNVRADLDYLGHRTTTELRTPIAQDPLPPGTHEALGALTTGDFTDARLTLDGPGGHAYVDWQTPLTAEEWVKAASPVEALDLMGASPLMRAAKENRLDVVKLLLAAGADPAIKDIRGYTALYYAADNGNLEMTRLLLEKHAPVEGAADWVPLEAAASAGYPQVVAALLKAGALPDGRDGSGRPLQQAAMAGRTECVDLLLKASAKTSLRSELSEWTPLHFAARFGYPQVIGLLLAAKADVNAQDNIGDTPLHVAARASQAAAVAALLKAKPLIDARNAQTQTPLMCAASTGNLATVELLLQAGAYPELTDSHGKSVTDYAMDGKNDDGLETLRVIAHAAAAVPHHPK